MRLPLAAACSFGALTVCHSNAIAQAATTPNAAPPSDGGTAQNWVIDTNPLSNAAARSTALANTVEIATPQTISQAESINSGISQSNTKGITSSVGNSTMKSRRSEAGTAALQTTPSSLQANLSRENSLTQPTQKIAARLPQLTNVDHPVQTNSAATPATKNNTSNISTTEVTSNTKQIAARPRQKSAIAPPTFSEATGKKATDQQSKSAESVPEKTRQSAGDQRNNFVIDTKPVTDNGAVIDTVSRPTEPSRSTEQPPANQPITPINPTPTNTQLPPNLAVTVLDVQITGVDADIQKILRDRLATRPGRQTSLAQINRDIATILSTELIANASFSTQVLDNGINVNFQATPVTVSRIELRNAQVLTPAVAQQIFQPQLGQAIQPRKLDQGVRAINQWYLENGYSLSRAIDVEPNRNGTLKLTVKEGKINDLKIRFVDEFGRSVDDAGKPIKGKTKESFIRREIQSQPGDIFQVGKIQNDLKNLYKTGLFSNAGVTIEGSEENPSIVYNLAEGSNRQANLGGGFSSDYGFFGSATYNDNNVGGSGNQIGGRILLGSRDLQFNGKFTRPFRESDPSRWGYSINAFRERGISRVFDDEVLLANGDQVREGRIGAGIGLTKSLSDRWNGAIDLGYARTSQRDSSGNVVQTDAAGNPLSLSGTGIDDQVTLGFSAGFDQVDNPANPKSGSRLRLSTEQGLPIGTGSSAANKLTANFTQYVPINIFNKNQKDRNKQEVFAFNVQGGTTIGALAPYKAFTLGGVNSVRGYGQGELGIGRSYIQASAEYRFPLISSLGGTVFADFASDLGSASLVPGAPGQARNRPGSGFGVGAGLRFNSPLGILRADWGFANNGTNRLQFTIGEKF